MGASLIIDSFLLLWRVEDRTEQLEVFCYARGFAPGFEQGGYYQAAIENVNLRRAGSCQSGVEEMQIPLNLPL
jgi:hypothetical protein